MAEEKIKRVKKNKLKKTEFNLTEVIIIMLITAICSITITIRVSYAINNTSKKLKIETELSELISTYDMIVNEYYKNIDKKEVIDAAIEGMVSCLDDPYSAFYTPEESEEFNRSLEGKYEGIGVEIVLTSDKKVTINRVFEDGPGDKAGLKKGDVILKVGSNSVENKTLSEISKMIIEDSKDEINLEIIRNNNTGIYAVKKGQVNIPSVDYEIINKNGKKIAKIDISTFADNTYIQFIEKYEEVSTQNIDGIILDLRGNTGGYLTTATSILEMFLNKGDVMYQLSTKGSTKKIVNTKDQKVKEKTVVLVNKLSASASEILTASLNENLGSEVVGVTTYGKGKVQKTKTLTNGSLVKYTIQNWLTPSGKEIDKTGIKPTIGVELDKKYYENPTNENDNQLQKALDIIVKN